MERDDTTMLAGIGQRFLALLCDWLLCLLIAGGLVRLGVLAQTDPGAVAGPEQLWPSLILAVEYGLFLAFFSQTPGMRLLRIHCVRVTDGRPLGLIRSFARGVALALVLPAVTAFIDPRRRGLHDVVAGSIMVRHPQTAPATDA
ncbi:putative RDD family membrane protein YckC [Stackebrandtia endophytica]|uniref:Putative RDD family membrane protein YckC n=2 Tax=Stackebrandtia endophytica TaxID=1496996 RepID=A0A543ARF6_9ACTN|nr:putative RDD family membrane protein YckC [Stackebrandtia endophytica]